MKEEGLVLFHRRALSRILSGWKEAKTKKKKNGLTVCPQHCLESRESWFLHVRFKKIKLEKTSFQDSELERISPSRRTCFSCICLDLGSQEHLSRPSLIPETEKEKLGKVFKTYF